MDYPRDYIVPNKEIAFGTAFVIMPIHSDFDMTYGLIIEVCQELGIQAKRDDDISQQDFIMSNILGGIAKSEIVIVDITGNNPNVFYELGIAHSLRARHSVIIITQDDDLSQSPFDIRHWSIIQYDNNKALFKALLKDKIICSRNIIDNDEFLYRLLSGYTFESSIIQDFLITAKIMGTQNLNLACCILTETVNLSLCNRNKIQELYQYLTSLGDYKGGIFAKITWLLKYLIFTSEFVLSQYIDTIKSMFLNKWQRDSIQMNDIDYWEFVTNICCKIIEKKHDEKITAISWLIGYLSNPRMGRIDRVRTKIEDFLLSVQDHDVDTAVIGMLIGNSRTAKESGIDICGQKPIMGSVNYLLEIIKNNDTDPHIVRSCINAFARMNITVAAPFILDWMQNNRDKWGNQAVSASLKSVAENALSILDRNAYEKLITIE